MSAIIASDDFFYIRIVRYVINFSAHTITRFSFGRTWGLRTLLLLKARKTEIPEMPHRLPLKIKYLGTTLAKVTASFTAYNKSLAQSLPADLLPRL